MRKASEDNEWNLKLGGFSHDHYKAAHPCTPLYQKIKDAYDNNQDYKTYC